MIITISGKAASGKTTLALTIKDNFSNVEVISLDEVNSELMYNDLSVKEFALKLFGEEVFEQDDILKAKVSKKIYNDENLYNAWCSFMKTKCEKVVLEKIEKNPHKIYIIEHILANETKFANLSDYRILVIADEQERIFRVINRDDITIEQLQQREKFLKVYNLNEFNLVYEGKDPSVVIETLKTVIPNNHN